MAPEAAGQAVGEIVFYIGVVALGVFFGKRLGRKRGGKFVWWPVLVAVALVLVALFGKVSSASQATRMSGAGTPALAATPQQAAAPADAVPIDASTASADVVVRQQAAGPASQFPTAFTPEFVAAFDGGVRESMVEGLRRGDAGLQADSVKVTTAPVTLGARQVLRSTVHQPGKLFMHQYTGVSGSNVVILVCVSKTSRPFEVAGTECERTATQVYAG